MKDKNKIVPVVVFFITFIVFISIFFILGNSNKKVYSCYDSENDVNYTFNTEEEMHEVCDKFITNDDNDEALETYDIYNDLIKVNDPDFAFYPHVSDNKLYIIISIVNCNNPYKAKEKAIKWFSDHSYNINDYNIEYEYPCEVG